MATYKAKLIARSFVTSSFNWKKSGGSSLVEGPCERILNWYIYTLLIGNSPQFFVF